LNPAAAKKSPASARLVDISQPAGANPPKKTVQNCSEVKNNQIIYQISKIFLGRSSE
jgi:hypothetical protein